MEMLLAIPHTYLTNVLSKCVIAGTISQAQMNDILTVSREYQR